MSSTYTSTDLPLVVGFLNQDHVREPSGIVSFFNEPYAQ